MTEAPKTTFPQAPDGDYLLPSAFTDDAGRPRFVIPFPKALHDTDMGLQALVTGEAFDGGFEAQTRRFFDAHVAPGDLFVDVGAHWGSFALTVASRFAGQRRVIAVEADPFNVLRLVKSVQINGLGDAVEVVAAAVSDQPGTIPLIGGRGTMGNVVKDAVLPDLPPDGMLPVSGYSVATTTVDLLLAEREEQKSARVFLKVDVEGNELAVLAGAKDLISSGRLAAAMIEKSGGYSREPHRAAFAGMLDGMKARGFSLHRFADRTKPGRLDDYTFDDEETDVLCLAPDLQPLPWYG